MTNKLSFSSILAHEAVEKMKVVLTSKDIRRLTVFTRHLATSTAMVKELTKITALFRLDPLKVLEMKGVGPMTLLTVQKLSKELQAQEVLKEFGVADNLAAVQTILNTMHRGISDKARAELNKARDSITRAQNIIENEKIEAGIHKAIKKVK